MAKSEPIFLVLVNFLFYIAAKTNQLNIIDIASLVSCIVLLLISWSWSKAGSGVAGADERCTGSPLLKGVWKGVHWGVVAVGVNTALNPNFNRNKELPPAITPVPSISLFAYGP